MNPVVELDRIIYFFKDKENRHENKLMLVKEKEGNQESWKPLSKGWEYQLWYQIGERGGLAEAEEIKVLEDGQEKSITIEEYVKLYRETLEKIVPIEEVFQRFDIHVVASRLKVLKRDYLIKTLEEEYKLDKVKEDEERIYYEKTIENAEQLEIIATNWIDKEHEVRMIFIEKNKTFDVIE